ncbi:MAG: hypothetical protein HQL32_15300 [Planctomycetes bacterium]|nr:hypothetical protein [Planctomycetota bacterium]
MNEEESYIDDGDNHICSLCGLEEIDVLKYRFYCDNCYDHLSQAYQWMQSPMLSPVELKGLQQQILDLTDVNKIEFE